MRLWEFAVAATIAEITPGPNMGYLTALALAQGRRAGLAAVAGVFLGLTILGLVTALGFGLIVQEVPWLGGVLRWAGIGYLFWLAWEAWRGETGDGAQAFAASFRRGLTVNMLNPKAAGFYIAVLPLFLDTTDDGIGPRLILTAVFVAIATTIHGSLVIGAASMRSVVLDPRREQTIRRIAAVLLALVAIWFAWETRAYGFS